ncbi:DUF4177 domain-containing protein [Amycolatopsis sp. NPDC051758]|uniref:DUF4177 domain-containing protein n=1 Tax=Amycolatopsis sp. NPDC051758 TaxID=3363935 RepID=UPI00379AF63C
MTTQWEYKVQTYKLGWKGFKYDQVEQDLTEHGREGWEAFSTLAPSFGQGQAMEIAVLLKRPAAG